MEVSVIIPTELNNKIAKEGIASAIDSLKKFPGSKELIIVLDYPKKRDDQFKKWLESHRFVKTIQGKGGSGPAGARAPGVKKAQGRVFLFTDSDCVVSPDWVGKM